VAASHRTGRDHGRPQLRPGSFRPDHASGQGAGQPVTGGTAVLAREPLAREHKTDLHLTSSSGVGGLPIRAEDQAADPTLHISQRGLLPVTSPRTLPPFCTFFWSSAARPCRMQIGLICALPLPVICGPSACPAIGVSGVGGG
jgi:hypothetical protein